MRIQRNETKWQSCHVTSRLRVGEDKLPVSCNRVNVILWSTGVKRVRWQILKPFLLWLSLVLVTSPALADVRLSAIMGDHMMLPQQIGTPLWGWADPGETVTVSGSWGKRASASADHMGKWKVCLNTPAYGGPHTLTIKGKNEITLNNVMIGEVWLWAGQSNMGWRLSATFEGVEDSASANYPNFCIFRSERCHSHEPQEDCVARWTPCTPETASRLLLLRPQTA